MVADRAGIHKDRISFELVFGDRVTTFSKHPSNLLRITLVHLSSVGFDEYVGHGLVILLE
ncbi:hypothetical protein [Rubritalea tangerina]|uniref:hypothetical protein n=1 Tax=Rubritalea tangerina TaxID=430798 RepID=UPI0036109E60